MKRTAFLSLLGTSLAGTVAAGEPRAALRPSGGAADPRSGPNLTILYKNQKDANASLSDAPMVFARVDTKPPNQILGVKGSFTDEQILTALKKFYREWRPSSETSVPRPKLIIAVQNRGGGSGLFEPLKKLSAEFEIDVYQIYPVTTGFQSRPEYPTANDKRLGELPNARSSTTPWPCTLFRAFSDSIRLSLPTSAGRARWSAATRISPSITWKCC